MKDNNKSIGSSYRTVRALLTIKTCLVFNASTPGTKAQGSSFLSFMSVKRNQHANMNKQIEQRPRQRAQCIVLIGCTNGIDCESLANLVASMLAISADLHATRQMIMSNDELWTHTPRHESVDERRNHSKEQIIPKKIIHITNANS